LRAGTTPLLLDRVVDLVGTNDPDVEWSCAQLVKQLVVNRWSRIQDFNRRLRKNALQAVSEQRRRMRYHRITRGFHDDSIGLTPEQSLTRPVKKTRTQVSPYDNPMRRRRSGLVMISTCPFIPPRRTAMNTPRC